MKKKSVLAIFVGTAVIFTGLMIVSAVKNAQASSEISSASPTITVYPDNRPGWESAVGVVYEEEFFTDATLNPGVSVVSDYPGYVNTVKGVWWDRLVCPGWGKTTTIWQFDAPIIGYGGNWNPGVPGGPGAHIAVAINGSWVNVGEISRYYTDQFWGFVSTEPFSAVRLSPGSYCSPPGGAWAETYELDNMVYSGTAVYPDFRIDKIDPVQVVWNPDINGDGRIDLVAGKSTMVRVEIGMENYEVLDKQQLIEVRLTFDGADYTESRTIEQLEQNKWIEYYPAFPITSGDQTITAIVDPGNKIDESDETNNESPPVQVTIKDTRFLHIGYTKIYSSQSTTYGTPSSEEFQNMVSSSGDFIKATYPVSGDRFVNEVNKKYSDYEGDPTRFLGMIEDMLSLAVLKFRSGVDREIGVTSDSYFTYHGLCGTCGCAKGVTLKGIKWAALIETGYWTAAAHEIGHTYGLRRDQEEYVFDSTQCKMTYHGNFAEGFWVERREPIENSICFMGSASPKHHFDRWIDEEDYRKLFQTFRVNKNDPKILILSGLVHKDGTVEFGKSYYLSNGILEHPTPGDYSIQLMDKAGAVIQEISFEAPFEMRIEPFGAAPLDFAPFAFAIPYPENTSKIQIQHNEKILIEINPNNKLLHDAVDLIPDYGFINNPEQRRKALHNKIEAVEKMIEQDNLKGAVNKLKFDIKDKFEKWLVDDYEVENPLQLSKIEIIGLIDEIIDRFNSML